MAYYALETTYKPDLTIHTVHRYKRNQDASQACARNPQLLRVIPDNLAPHLARRGVSHLRKAGHAHRAGDMVYSGPFFRGSTLQVEVYLGEGW